MGMRRNCLWALALLPGILTAEIEQDHLLDDLAPGQAPKTPAGEQVIPDSPVKVEAPAVPDTPVEPEAIAVVEPVTPAEIAPNPELDVGEIEAVDPETLADEPEKGELVEAVAEAVETPPEVKPFHPNVHDVSYGFEPSHSAIAGISFFGIGAPHYSYGIDGIRLSIGAYGHRRVRGLDIGLGSYITKDVTGLQVNLFTNMVGRDVRGVQIGIYNKAIRTYGVQIGLLNVSDTLYGLQIGVANVNQHSVLPILNIGW